MSLPCLQNIHRESCLGIYFLQAAIVSIISRSHIKYCPRLPDLVYPYCGSGEAGKGCGEGSVFTIHFRQYGTNKARATPAEGSPSITAMMGPARQSRSRYSTGHGFSNPYLAFPHSEQTRSCKEITPPQSTQVHLSFSSRKNCAAPAVFSRTALSIKLT